MDIGGGILMSILFETERLIIREWEMRDKEDLYEYASDPIVTKYLTFPTYTSISNAEDRINYLNECYKEDTYMQDYAIELRLEGKVIGAISVVEYSPKVEGSAELGYCMNKNYFGHGYMTEAVKGYIEYLFSNNIVKRIQAKHDVENVKSGNVMKRAGMTFEGIRRKAGQNNLHTRHDLACYSILYEEYMNSSND